MSQIKKKGLCLLLAGVLIPCSLLAELDFSNEKNKLSYTLGVKDGENLKAEGLDLNFEYYYRGLIDASSGHEYAMTDEEMRELLVNLQKKVMAQMQSKMAEREQEAKKSLVDAQKIAEKNKKDPAIVTLPSGLQYKVIKAGSGPKQPKLTDTVKVHYRGSLLNGTEFDSSYKRKMPAEFRVDGVIQGWQEALPMMQTGAIWQLFIPAELAYGKSGHGPIPPNATLIFEVELLDVIG